MKIAKRIMGIIAITVISNLWGCSNKEIGKDKIELINVSYDTTRELYEEYNELFKEYWKGETGQELNIVQSHGGSGKQARSIVEGNEADIVSLALAYDIYSIEKAGLIEKGWISEFEENSSPYTSTIVFLVRRGNEKNIKDWDDLTRKGVEIVTSNPKTSGGACWNFIASWEYAKEKYDNDEEKVKEFIFNLYKNVIILDSGARAATTSFVENKQGDVLLIWENEAMLALNEYPNDFEIVTPSVSILAEPTLAVVDYDAKKRGTEDVAKRYIEFLYTEEAQRIIAKHNYRPRNKKILEEYKDKFNPNIKLISIDNLGGWEKAYRKFFEDGAIFDEIYAKISNK